MKKMVLALFVCLSVMAANAQINPAVMSGDTLVIHNAKFIKIGEKVYPLEVFQKAEPVFLPLQYWQAVIEMLRNATGVNMKPEEMIGLINAIAQQLPQKSR